MAGHEAGFANEVRRPHQLVAEAQVRDGRGAGFLRVVDEIALGEFPSLLADDLDRILVGAHSAIGAEAEEYGASPVRRLDIDGGIILERQAGDVVVDANGERVLWLRPAELGEDGEHHRGGELFRGKAVAAADDGDAAGLRRKPACQFRFAQGGDNVDIERFADRAGLLGAVKHGDRADGWRQRGRECLD